MRFISNIHFKMKTRIISHIYINVEVYDGHTRLQNVVDATLQQHVDHANANRGGQERTGVDRKQSDSTKN